MFIFVCIGKHLEPLSEHRSPESRKITSGTVLPVIGTLVLFLFALDMMISVSQHLGEENVGRLIGATADPFTALFIGLLITAMVQSSSTTTALVVALVASGSLPLKSAVPIVMGANIGTTITSTIVSLGFIAKKKEFKRAVAAGTYHCFFNLLTVVVLFPLEYFNNFLISISLRMQPYLLPVSDSVDRSTPVAGTSLFDPLIDLIISVSPNAVVSIVVSFVLLFGSILLFRRLIANILQARSPGAFSRFFFKSRGKSFLWGFLTTAAIRSSTITTSVVVPIVAEKIATLKQAAPFIIGANVGTTVTAIIAAILNPQSADAATIALTHFLFNIIGMVLFFPIHPIARIPLELARGLGRITSRNRWTWFAFILLTFFIVPLTLIYLHQR
jgi:solute carrier family 34 (sodium-dependent phosphate cotransporter)